MKLIGITGPARSGKDTIGDMLCDNYPMFPIGFADALKNAAATLLNRSEREMHGLDDFDRELILPEWGFSTRHFLQVLGTEGCRKLFREDFWINRVKIEIKGHDNVVITDVRFENEAAFVREMGGEVWHVTRDTAFNSGLDQEAKAHASEVGVKFVPLKDYLILNDGTLDNLWERVEWLWTQYE